MLLRMSNDDASDLRLRAGKIRDRSSAKSRRPRSFVAQVMKAVTKAKGMGIGPSPKRGGRSDRRRDGASSRPRKGRCCRIGRGQAAAERLKLAAERRGPGERMRRVVVKARIVKLRLGSKGADAHLRYLQRDGTDREGERGRLYGSETDAVDGRSFLERGREDRHQFRFIVAPEDGDRLSDLHAFTRDVMKQMDEDLGTKLDWVAVDHFNTGHPHSHVVVRGKDDTGKDLIIAQDYITDGLRLRAQELATLELGPETDLELRSKLTSEITAERFTRIDRAMLAEAGEGTLDLRPETGQVRADFDRTLRIGRLQTLARYGLAMESEPGVWKLSDQMEPTLRELGERGDIVKAINRALKARGEERALESYSLRGEEAKIRIVGRVIDKRLTDCLVVDGVDGRVHHVTLGSEAMVNTAEEASIGSIVEIAPAPAGPRPADRNIAELAGASGDYRPSVHRIIAEASRVRVPGGDYSAYVESHVRRLEALRRAGIVERIDADHWRLPPDFETRAADYDAQRRGRITLRVLSSLDLESQIDANGATWLDREMTSSNRAPIVRAGFGAEVDRAMKQRRVTLVEMGHARRTPENVIRAPGDLVSRLERSEIERVGTSMATNKHAPFKMKAEGERVSGVFIGTANLISGKYAVVENAYEFTLVPWRPVMDDRLGRQISGVVRDSGISWDFTRTRGIGIGM